MRESKKNTKALITMLALEKWDAIAMKISLYEELLPLCRMLGTTASKQVKNATEYLFFVTIFAGMSNFEHGS